VAPFDHPFLGGLLGDAETAALFAAEVEIARMVRFEAALAEAEAAEGLIPADAAGVIVATLRDFVPEMAALAAGTARDGVVVPELVRQLRRAVGEPHGAHLHHGATSQDAIDTAATLALLDALGLFSTRLDALEQALQQLAGRFGTTRVMAHTRMQAAIEVPAARKIDSWSEPLARHRQRLARIAEEIAVLHLGGAAGTLDRLGDRGPAVAERLGAALGLRPVVARHSERDGFADAAGLLSLITGSLGKLGQDVALAAQSETGEIRLASGGGSSAMPHKSNPVKAEMLVAMARFNATLLSGMHQALVHENERSGAAWTLEWMLLPQMAVATGAALRTALELVPEIAFSARS
jgi:3-carboxy-cis,cis-muconate cycloisomerase